MLLATFGCIRDQGQIDWNGVQNIFGDNDSIRENGTSSERNKEKEKESREKAEGREREGREENRLRANAQTGTLLHKEQAST